MPRTVVVRWKRNGRLDGSFGLRGVEPDLGAYSDALAVALQRNGKIVLAGTSEQGVGT